jgi:hypothetical protein
VQLLFPNGTTAPPARPLTTFADRFGYARPSLVIHYNPISSYAQAQLIVTVSRLGHTEVVPGSVTIAQATPLLSTSVRARPAYLGTWCTSNSSPDAAACKVRNGANVVIRVDTDPGAQVNVTLSYPDGTSIAGPANELTSTAFTDQAGVYRCELPVVYQAKNRDKNVAIVIKAQVSLGGYTQTRSLQLTLVTR